MIVAIFISQDRLGFDSVIENPKMLVSLPKKTLFLTHATCPTWVGEGGTGEMERRCSAPLLPFQSDRAITI